MLHASCKSLRTLLAPLPGSKNDAEPAGRDGEHDCDDRKRERQFDQGEPTLCTACHGVLSPRRNAP
jgi:hypothetical protein